MEIQLLMGQAGTLRPMMSECSDLLQYSFKPLSEVRAALMKKYW